MARVAVVKQDSSFDGTPLKKGERFRIVDSIQEPSDIMLLMQVDMELWVPVDLGTGYAVMTKFPGEDGESFDTYFTEEQA